MQKGLIHIFDTSLHSPSSLTDKDILVWVFFVFQDISLAAKESAAAQLEAIKVKYEEAVELRKKAELDIETFRPVRAILLPDITGNKFTSRDETK